MQDVQMEIYPDGSQRWVRKVTKNLHREDGPAIVYADGHVIWALNNTLLTFNRWCNAMKITDQQKLILAIKYPDSAPFKTDAQF